MYSKQPKTAGILWRADHSWDPVFADLPGYLPIPDEPASEAGRPGKNAVAAIPAAEGIRDPAVVEDRDGRIGVDRDEPALAGNRSGIAPGTPSSTRLTPAWIVARPEILRIAPHRIRWRGAANAWTREVLMIR